VSELNLRAKILILLFALTGLATACTGAATTPTPAATEIPPTATLDFVVVTGSGDRATLPPTWTPTPSFTPAPPTLSPTPTATFTPVPTFTAAEICEHFTIATKPETRPYLTDESIHFLYWSDIPDALVNMSIINVETGVVSIAGAYPAAVTIGGAYGIDTPGEYEWTVSVTVPPYEELCQETGTFTVVEPPDGEQESSEDDPESTPEVEVTPESISTCPEFTVDPQFEEGQTFGADDVLTILLDTDDEGLFIRFVATRRDTGENHTIQIPGGHPFNLDMPVQLMFGNGVYDWTASLYSDATGETCATSGTFVVSSSAAGSLPIVGSTPDIVITNTPFVAPPTLVATVTATATATCVRLSAVNQTATALAITATTPIPTVRATTTACATATQRPTRTPIPTMTSPPTWTPLPSVVPPTRTKTP
jgi:hypothetical protein